MNLGSLLPNSDVLLKAVPFEQARIGESYHMPVDMSGMFKQVYGDYCANELTAQEKALTKADKQKMRKWAKKSRKALLLELVRLQKQCHKNWSIAEDRYASAENLRGKHDSEIRALNSKLEGVLLAIRTFKAVEEAE